MAVDSPSELRRKYNRCGNLLGALARGTFDFEVVAHNIELHMVDGDEAQLQFCMEQMSADFLKQYFDWLRNFLEPVDFMPDAYVFMVNTNETAHESKKRELRPKYIRLYQLVGDSVARQ